MKKGMKVTKQEAEKLMLDCVHVFREIKPSLLVGYARYEMANGECVNLKDGVVL